MTIEEKAIEAYPEEGEYDHITELEFLRRAYLQGAKEQKELIIQELENHLINRNPQMTTKNDRLNGYLEAIELIKQNYDK